MECQFKNTYLTALLQAMVLHDRRVISSIAQSREGIKTFLKEKKEEAKEKDTRNLYLANEGFVRPGEIKTRHRFD